MAASPSRHLLFLLLPLLTAAAAPPPTPVREVVDDYFGTKIVDPYRWLEKTADPEVEGWMKAQNDHARATLARIPGRDRLLERIKELDNAGDAAWWMQVWGGRYFYYKTEPDSDNRRLYVRDRATGSERLLIDPEKLTTADGKHFSIDYFKPSIDGEYVAYGLSRGGSEESVLHVLETATGKVLTDTIDRAQVAQPSWRPDGKSFFYTRLQKLAADAPPTARFQKMRTYLHKLGDDPEKDVLVFGYGVSSRVKVLEDDFSFVTYSPGAPKYLIGMIAHGVKNEIDLYAVPFENTLGAKAPWKKIADHTEAISGFAVHGDEIYLVSHKGASRFKVLRTSLAKPDLARAVAVVPASERVITYITAAGDALYIRDLDAGLGKLRRLPYRKGTAQPVDLPFEGAVQALVTNPTAAGAWLQLISWTKSPLWYAFDPREAKMTDTKLVASSPVDFSQIESKEVKARSADGTLVPLSIVHRRGLKLDGTNIGWLEGYGAYGSTLDPTFRPTLLAFLERGGVYAIAHVRGGGEFGEDWHLAGQKLTKQNTIDDFIACAQYLFENKYSSPARLAGVGKSAGGITIGGAITQHPEMFGAALIRVGATNTLRTELMASGPANVSEFGTTKDADGFKALYAMDAYHQVKPDTPYPAVLLTTGANDLIVAPWQSAKMTARLQASTRSGKPVLLRVDYEAGHGMGSKRSQRNAELADEMAFLFWQLGLADFQPIGAVE
jgi:prolyl oligopeptidase